MSAVLMFILKVRLSIGDYMHLVNPVNVLVQDKLMCRHCTI